METTYGIGVGGHCRGAIVWVRRRNGSWWPGRILGLDELSASHLMSPKSGTPVKLLGRENASVDWYNLEKSKRVKEFRCREFDACIERAEASQNITIKKREKYARREDAILHALELEKQQKLETTSNGKCSKINRASKSDSVSLSSPHGKLSSHKFKNFLKKIASSHERENVDDLFYLHEGSGNQKLSVECDNAGAIPRMGGLQNFRLQTTRSKRKPSLSRRWEKSRESVDNHVKSVSKADYTMEGTDQASTSRNAVSVKRKRSYGGVIDGFLVKKCDRRRPLVRVLESSADHGLIEKKGSDYCEHELLEPDMLEETDATNILLPGSEVCDPPELQVSGEFRSSICEDLPLSAFMPQLNGQDKEASLESSVSKWRMKGKRNIRNVGKKLVGPTFDVSDRILRFGSTETASGQLIPKSGFSINEEFKYAHDETDSIDKDLDQSQSTVCGNMRSHCSLHVSDENPQFVYVDLKVQSSCQGELVPMVSLMSRLNGKAILGHPIQIEMLEDGSANHLIVSTHDVVMDEGAAPQVMWWTARRTTMHRVPRSFPSTAVSREEDRADLACGHYVNHQATSTKKSEKKNARRASLSSRKMRKLSLLSSEEKLRGEGKLARNDGIFGDEVPLATCIPVKIVFRRILEAVGRP
ncbi:hypothetical protein KSP39_PZI008630 [Platanthera zijinensis]|uniref:PWWP domain-containing protein n=1 Tax=Platanthera zijinensis TaxID=2320716 RepID=A0AAP0BPT7_9ASPA